MNNRNWARLSVVVLLLALLTGCQAIAAESMPEGRIKIGGSTSTEPVVAILAEEFMKQHPDVTVTVRGGGSGLGVKGVGYEGFHIGMTSRPLNEEEMAQWPDMQTIPIARDGVAVVVSRFLYNTGVDQLTFDQVAGLWRGEYNNWIQLGGVVGLPVRVFDEVASSGTRATFIEAVFGGDDPVISDSFGRLATSEEVLAAVANTRTAVSMLSIGLQTDEVVGVPLEDTNGLIVEPTLENVANGSYPIIRDLNLVVEGTPQGWEKAFIDFALSPQGQTLVEQAGYGRVAN